jgi:hypothetical protein
MTDEQPWYTSIAELRAEVIKQHKRVGSKISYNKTKKGIEISDTRFDPRVSVDQIKTMNKKQLTTQLKKLKSFSDRSTAFVPADSGAPIPKSLWDKLEATRLRYNTKVVKVKDKIGPIFLPRNGMTIAERQASIKPKDSVTSHGAVTTPHAEEEARDSTDFASAAAVQKMIDRLNKKMSRKFDKERVERDRDSARQMLEVMGSDDLNEQLDALSDRDFDLLWSYGGFAEDLSDDYEWFKLRAAGYRKDDIDAAVMDESKRAAVIQGLQWIEEVKKSRSQKG